MEIKISQEAMDWFKEEVGVEPGNGVRFYSQIYGTSPVQEGFALGFTVDNEPKNVAVQTKVDDVLFFVEEGDVWFFNGHDLHIDYNKQKDEIEFNYVKP
ncbi:HesB/YadR/YfhF family protein [Pullulanibacillus sp. KACC 23026]|uniref:HesB/YadR/YfhF family protein n=1 Tax=Pullulanibacillus sp. KACC 23026 TaxID=3028315 RepID=UPI0023B1A847|nr:HesB/YadR/YfhF family protein [Pullulanibacillus sp. KACC 23026]WEG12178.1 HesB/YadR/YfhF family protein [Pullulanibacillus sp. KACC 23026]